ncbi:MAG: hypothetical protein MJ165_02985 [Alphaproteobacteria bacterium]|nr:hypothetical protein [Alphaproteobacteria bacterium]
MQRFSVTLLLCLFCVNATAGAHLPVVDVYTGMVSARAAFGEEIESKRIVSVAPVKKQVAKKVVARNAKKSVKNNMVASNDVLRPMRPSSDLWANNDAPLRVPRMDEISVITSNELLPEESLSAKPVKIAKKTVAERETKNQQTINEINALREEIARLNELQKRTEQAIANVRPVLKEKDNVKNDVKIAQTSSGRNVNVKREVVPMDTDDVKMNSVATKRNEISEPKFTSVNEMSRMSPTELKKAFKKTYMSENKHLSTYQIDDRYDVASDMSSDIEGFSAQRDLSENSGGVRPLEVKISFLNGDSALSRENYNILNETASIVVNNPKRAIQVAIPESATYTKDGRKLAARRLAIVEQVLRDTGVAEQRIVPVLSQRSDDVFVLRVISGDVFETLTQQKRNMFGDNVSKKTYKSMTW